jgi:hypothetical protein
MCLYYKCSIIHRVTHACSYFIYVYFILFSVYSQQNFIDPTFLRSTILAHTFKYLHGVCSADLMLLKYFSPAQFLRFLVFTSWRIPEEITYL